MAALSDNFQLPGPKPRITRCKSNKFLFLFFVFCLTSNILAGCGFQGEFSIAVSPATTTIGLNKTQQFFATAIDAQGNIVSKAFSWGFSGSVGTIDANGLFYSGSVVGSGFILVSSEGVTGKASVSLTDKGSISGRLRNVLGNNLSSISIVFTGASIFSASTN